MFNTGDKVTYGAVGVCEIKDITENELTGELRKYYVLNPVDSDKSTIYVPVLNEKLTSRMRKIPSKPEFKSILSKAKKDELSWCNNNFERNDKFHAILNDGDIKENIKLLRALNKRANELHKIGKHLPKADERIFKECSKLVCAEISLILSIDNSEVLPLVLN